MKTVKLLYFKIKKSLSFTLIEVLITIGIMAILAGIVFVAIHYAWGRARDTVRISDLNQIQKSLETYYIDSGIYPISTSNYEIEGAPWGSSWEPYMNKVPKDPLPTQSYAYVSDGFSYQLYAKFEGTAPSSFACGSCGPNSLYNGGLASSGSKLVAFEIPPPSEEKPTPSPPKEEKPTPSPIVLAEGKQTYIITGGHHSPSFSEVTIDPLDVKVGDTQKMSAKISDTFSITSVAAHVETDTGTKIYPLSLIGGTDLSGTWEGSWTVYDTHSAKYKTTFTATDSNNESSSVTLTWSDPCSPPAGGNWTLDGNCNIATGTVSGVDNGNFTVAAGFTLTLDVNSTFVFNSGKSIIWSGGSIAKGSGAQVKKTNLWMIDADLDGYPATLTQYAQDDPGPTNGRRRKDITHMSTVDGDDGFSCTTDYAEATGCTTACKGCLNGACINIPSGSQDTYGSNFCNATHYRCDGSGSCTAPCSGTSCIQEVSSVNCTTQCANSGACGCYIGHDTLAGACTATNYSCSDANTANGWCECYNFQY